MIPISGLQDIEIIKYPSKTWCVLETNKVEGMIEGIEAVRQFVNFVLNTEKYAHEIYSWDWGIEFNDLYGRPSDFVYPELKRRIIEALIVDDRILSVEDFSYKRNKNMVLVNFKVVSVYGEISVWKEVIN